MLRRTKNLIASQARGRRGGHGSARPRVAGRKLVAGRQWVPDVPLGPRSPTGFERACVLQPIPLTQLPKKLDYVVYCELTGLQLEAYRCGPCTGLPALLCCDACCAPVHCKAARPEPPRSLLPPSTSLLCSNVLEAPDLDLIWHCYEPCPCGSGAPAYKCCGWKCDVDHGGVLWPLYHECE